MSYWDELPEGTTIYTLTETGFVNACKKARGFPLSCSLAFNTRTDEVFAFTQKKQAKLKKCWQDEEPLIADKTGYDIVDLGSASRPLISGQSPNMITRIQKALERQRYQQATVIACTFH